MQLLIPLAGSLLWGKAVCHSGRLEFSRWRLLQATSLTGLSGARKVQGREILGHLRTCRVLLPLQESQSVNPLDDEEMHRFVHGHVEGSFGILRKGLQTGMAEVVLGRNRPADPEHDQRSKQIERLDGRE